MTTVTALTAIAIQFAPEGEIVTTTWGDFRANNVDAFTSDEFGALAAELANGSLVSAGMALIWIEE